MRRFTTHTGRALPLRRNDVDTDQIIPSDYLKRVTRTGFAAGLFAAWRGQPGFVLDDPRFAGASILLAGDNFGIGSSREHAVWALQDHGFRAVVSPGFADIFKGNAVKNGLLPVRLDTDVVEALIDAVERDPDLLVTVDLAGRELATEDGSIRVHFQVDDHTRWRMLGGYDDIALSLRHEDLIAAYERHRRSYLPTVR